MTIFRRKLKQIYTFLEDGHLETETPFEMINDWFSEWEQTMVHSGRGKKIDLNEFWSEENLLILPDNGKNL